MSKRARDRQRDRDGRETETEKKTDRKRTWGQRNEQRRRLTHTDTGSREGLKKREHVGVIEASFRLLLSRQLL